MKAKTYVIGHRNPDSDAICSAIGYAAFKHATGMEDVIAARCGNSNARIDTILGRFGIPLPAFVGDVTPRVRDVMVSDVITVRPDSICMEALELMDRHDVRVLPVTETDGRLVGAVSIFALGQYFVPKPRKERQMRMVITSIANIIRALQAEVIHAAEPDRLEQLFVRIGAMDIRSFGHYYGEDEDLARSSIIVVGDRYDIQQRSIQSGVRMLVISGGLPVDEDVVAMAKERNVSIVISPHDSATTSWIIRSAGQVDQVMATETLNFRPDEKLAPVARKFSASRQAASMVVDEQGRLVGVLTRSDLLKPATTRLILVDHNELSQAVIGADHVEILEVVDHHRLGNPPTQQPILFINLPVGSTSTIVAEQFNRAGLTPEPAVAGILMGGIISDTLFLKGPTTTPTDQRMLSWLESICGVSAADLSAEMFSAGSVISSEPVEGVVRADLKVYDEGPHRFAVSQIEELGFDALWQRCAELHAALLDMQQKDQLLFAALLVTDINTQNSLLLIQGDDTLIGSISYPHHASHNIFELNGIVSRKKQLIPYLTALVNSVAAEPAT